MTAHRDWTSWTSQPQEAVGPNPYDTLGDNLGFLWNAAHSAVDLASGWSNADGDNFSLNSRNVSNQHGRALRSAVDSNFVNLHFGRSTKELVSYGKEYSFGVMFHIRSVAARSAMAVSDRNGASSSIALQADGTIRGTGHRANTAAVSDGSYVAGDLIRALFVARSGDFRLWINGIKQSGVGTASISDGPTMRWVTLNGSNNDLFTGFVVMRALNDDEARRWTTNPWRQFAPLDQPNYAAPTLTTPTLSAATLASYGSTTARPRVTLTF